MPLTKDKSCAVHIPRILLPAHADMRSWAVIACDQFTGDEAYWRQVSERVCGKDSTYSLIFPEIYLKDNPEGRIAGINAAMNDYLSRGVFEELEEGFILVERTTEESGTRTGLVIAVDLESYSFTERDALIRSTEATIPERIPPRVQIRRDAPLELPHVILLYDDPQFKVLGAAQKGRVLYDSDLMLGGGHVKGTLVSNSGEVMRAFCSLTEGQQDKLLFAVGDGNHSLAAAKTCWEDLKSTLSKEQQATHPARFALCEAINIYDPAMNFLPIHRLILTAHADEFVAGWPLCGTGTAQAVTAKGEKILPFPADVPQGIAELDRYIAAFLGRYGGEADYIHGDGELRSLAKGGAGVLLPSIQKSDFFNLIKKGGNLPKKTFSLGEGTEKRYYIEAKRIK